MSRHELNEQIDRDWERKPGDLWFKRKPDFCSLTIVGPISDDQPATGGPAFTTRYKRSALPLTPQDYNLIEVVKLERSFVADGKRTVSLKATEHACGECPPPRVIEVEYTAKEGAVDAFWSVMDRTGSFLWILSTESFEARAIVDLVSGQIRAKFATSRVWH